LVAQRKGIIFKISAWRGKFYTDLILLKSIFARMNKILLPLLCAAALVVSASFRTPAPQVHSCAPEWGFFGHKRINRMAVMTLPPQMMVFFKPNIDYLTDHAADPDMRRYAVNWEAPRHYIDLDEYQVAGKDYDLLWIDALLNNCEIKGVSVAGDTLLLYNKARRDTASAAAQDAWKSYFFKEVMWRFSSDDKTLNADSLSAFVRRQGMDVPAFTTVFFTETLSAHGILPWNLQQMQKRLTNAFREKDSKLILKICADIGHYIGDAHVPLHTTSNYNGQKTNQYGIHGFWESRIPELFADASYDYFVGKPEYIERPSTYFWNVIFESHKLVDSVLSIEWALRSAISADQQICPDVRQGKQVLTQCREFAAAYQANMRGMVERRMVAAIHAVASSWYSAWLDAGSPDLTEMDVKPALATDEEELKQKFENGKILGRPEEH